MTTLEAVRAKLATHTTGNCDDPNCRGWFIDHETMEPTRCDQCWSHHPAPLMDDEVALLPEAQAERAQTITWVHMADHGTCYGLFARWCPHCLAKLSWLKRRKHA